MNPYYPLLYLVFTYQPCKRFHLEHLEHGRHKDLIDECISQEYIDILKKNENGDYLYCITEKGKQIVDNPYGESL